MLDVEFLILIIIGFFWGGLTAPVSIRLAEIYGILDIPDARKIHKVNTPRGGGLGIWAGYMLMVLFMSLEIPALKFISAGATIIFLCGYLDDMCSLSPFLRLGLHFFASALSVFPLGLSVLNSAVALVWVAGVTSAYNLIDGVNGLCISIFIASSGSLYLLGNSYPGVYMAAMALGVLCWNFPMAQTFLGDGGSTLLGYLFASHFLIISSSVLNILDVGNLITMLILFGGIPVIDTIIAFSRRMIAGRSPFYPDKGHLHHLLIKLTDSAVVSVTVLLFLQSIALFCGFIFYERFILK